MREIEFYRTRAGRSPVLEFLRGLTTKQADKVDRVLGLIRQSDIVPVQYFTKLPGTAGLWEVRVQQGGNAFRILCFLDGPALVVLVSAFGKKTEQTPGLEIHVAEQRRRDYLERKQRDG